MLRTRLFSFCSLVMITALSSAHADDDAPPPKNPGGSFKIATGVTCDAKHDHCLRPQARFLLLDDSEARVVFAARGHWWDWQEIGKQWWPGDAVTTAPATIQTVKVGDVVLIYNGQQDDSGLPQGETAAHLEDWSVRKVVAIDAAAGTITTSKKVWSIARVRVITGQAPL